MRVNPTKLLVQDILEVEEKSKGGILMPTAILKPNTMKGRVVIKGEGTPDIKIIFNEGETVLYHPNSGTKLKYEDNEYRIIDVSDVFLGGL